MHAVYRIELIFFVLYSRLPHFIWGDVDGGYGGTIALLMKAWIECSRLICHKYSGVTIIYKDTPMEVS